MTARQGLTRRELLRCSAVLPVVALPMLHGCGGEPLCADPDTLSRGEEQMRKTREYTQASPFDQRNCASCEFFQGEETGQCGHCEILNGPVNAGGFCSSWAA